MLIAQRAQVTVISSLLETHRLIETPGRDQRLREQTALPLCLWMIVAAATYRLRQQILAGQHRQRLLVLPVQRGGERLARHDTHRNQLFAHPAAIPLLQRERRLDVGRCRQALRNQEFSEKHGHSRVLVPPMWRDNNSPDKWLVSKEDG